MPRPRRTTTTSNREAKTYQHPEADLAARPEIGTQAHFKKAKPPTTYRFDSSLAPELCWDGENPQREFAESLLDELAKVADALAAAQDSAAREAHLATARDLLRRLRALSGPFLNWSGKAERLSFDVPTLPLFVHERLSTRAILETLKGHARDRQESFLDTLFACAERPLHDQVLRAYEHRDAWVNRLMLGDSLVVMNSLLRFESLGGQVQCIYIDPPYGVKFGSNFQPFIRKRNVKHGEDDDFTREPEMVQAYRDTWELGLHSYLTYLRDRLLLARELLAPSGSVFVQISDENLHHVREVMDEVFGAENFVVIICYRRLGMMVGETMQSSAHYLVWYAKDRERMKADKVFDRQVAGVGSGDHYTQIEDAETRETRVMTAEEKANPSLIPSGWKPFQLVSLTTGGFRPNTTIDYEFQGKTYHPGANKCWRTTKEGLDRLAKLGRIVRAGNTLRFKMYLDDFPLTETTTIWDDTARDPENLYVVQTPSNVIRRCILMTTDPGDLVLDPTCGSGTTAFVAEQWGRRWITCDTSRVPLALARQRLLTATFSYYELADEARGPAGGFVYRRRQNARGEEVGGIVPHVTLKSIANHEPPAEEVLVDRPEVVKSVVRVTGAFTFEATIPTAEGLDPEPETPGLQSAQHQTHVERMIEVLRRAPVLRLPGNQSVTLKNIRPPAKTLALSAEAVMDKPSLGNLADDAATQPALERETEPVAIVFGPENGAISERLVREAWDEAGLKRYARLFVIGFAIESKAREFVENAGKIGMPAAYLQATMDLQMGDLLKNMRSSQVFSVCGLPDVKVARASSPQTKQPSGGTPEPLWQVELLGLDTFDPATMEPSHLRGDDVPAWLLDTDYNGLVFRVRQAFFPRTGAWENLKKSLKVEFEDTVWDHLAGTTSAPFPPGEHDQIAVKVIDPRGNELLVVRKLEEESTKGRR